MIKVLLLESSPYFDLPYQLIGWLGWFMLASVILWIVRQNQKLSRHKNFWIIFFILLAFTILTTLFFGVELRINKPLPLPNIPQEEASPVVLVLSMIPLLVAGGFLGVWPAAILGFISGLFIALWNTHSAFTPLETALLATIMAVALRQDYRTVLFKFVRRPIGAALVGILFSAPLFLISTFFSVNGSFAAKLDYAFTQSWILMTITGLQILIAGLLCELFNVANSSLWVKNKSYRPSPIEAGLQTRILYTALPMVFVLLIALAIADWVVAGKAARGMMENQLESSAKIAAENIPSIMETGQSLTSSIVGMDLPLNESELLVKALQAKIREIPFFNQLFIFDLTGAPITGYPATTIGQMQLSSEEEAGIQLALNGVAIQNYLIAPSPGGKSAQISFIASIPDEYGLSKGVVIARTNFTINLFSQPALMALEGIKNAGGEGAILDEMNRVLFHTSPNLIMSAYNADLPAESGYFEDPGATGTRNLNYMTLDKDRGWKVVLSLPASYSQDLALRIAIPLLAISLAISFLAYLLLRYMMKTLTSSLIKLAVKADEISKGEFESKIETKGVDEIGRLGSAFEQMRQSLKSRLDELDTLLSVSRGVSSSLDIGSASQHLLKALRSYGADASSLVLVKNSDQGWEEEFSVYRDGESAEIFAALDRILFELLKDESILVIPSKTRIKRMGLPKGSALPSALAGIAIRSGTEFLGFLWIVYSQPHRFLDPEVRFLNTLAGQAVLAVTNSNLFLQAEVGKRRLESVLTSTPEPVFVVGEAGQLLLANQAARQMTNLVKFEESGGIIFGEIISAALREYLINSTGSENEAEELELDDGRTYLVSVSPVEVEQSHLGKVCVLRDVTEYKELEKMKSEFVSTVSHDLKAPLSLIRGYASMLQMVGELNPQQKEYSSKIQDGIDNISRMADNLLDLGRIDSGMDLRIEKIIPSELFDHVVGLLQPQSTNRKIQVMRELTLAQESAIEADKALLQQALFNLLENAIKFSSIGGQINLRLQVTDKTVIFEIQDHGPGIAPIDQPVIFDRFKRINKGDVNSARGSGLGLSIVKSIAQRHHGKVWVESTLGKGCTFYLEIPIHQKGKTGRKLAVKN